MTVTSDRHLCDSCSVPHTLEAHPLAFRENCSIRGLMPTTVPQCPNYRNEGLAVSQYNVAAQSCGVNAGESTYSGRQLVDVVRCGECKHGDPETIPTNSRWILCRRKAGHVIAADGQSFDAVPIHPPDWYCADGERE
jgi:hypothetical protein